VAAGDIEFLGKPIKGQGPWDLVMQGLVMVPEGAACFSRMTITENLQMGAVRPQGQGSLRRHRQGVRHLSAPEGAPQPARRHDVGRRAADARDGAGR
jgi:ABC-type branched-subunit amino acid transport system ATPase component